MDNNILECTNCKKQFVPPSRQNTKFCSKECCKQHHNTIRRKTSHEWGSLKKQQIELQNDKYKQYKELSNTHYTRAYLRSIGVNENTMVNFFKLANISYDEQICNITYFDDAFRGGATKFFDKLSCDKYLEFLKTKKIDGYISQSEILKILNIADHTFKTYKDQKFPGLDKPIVLNFESFHKKDIFDKWLKKLPDMKHERIQKIKLEEQKRLLVLKEKNKTKREETLQRNKLKKEQQLKKHTAWKESIRLRRLKEREEVEKRKLGRLSAPKKDRIVRRIDNWTSWENYEAKIKKKINDPTYKIREKDALINNIFYHTQHDLGNIVNLTCQTCNLNKPYYEFYFMQSAKKGRHTKKCKECTPKLAKNNANKNKTEGDFLAQFCVAIKRDINKRNNKYMNLSNREIWNNLGYNKKQFIDYILSIKEDWMTWDNNRRASRDTKCWHLDHVIPKVSFNYTSINDEAFKKCWSLSNLKPIKALVNIIKSDHKTLNVAASSIFKSCVLSRGSSKSWDIMFNYSIDEAKIHLEKQFSDGMSWENFGTYWHIDHIIPKASLPFETTDDDNYKKLWSLANLRPLNRSENCSKGSKHDNIKYFTIID